MSRLRRGWLTLVERNLEKASAENQPFSDACIPETLPCSMPSQCTTTFHSYALPTATDNAYLQNPHAHAHTPRRTLWQKEKKEHDDGEQSEFLRNKANFHSRDNIVALSGSVHSGLSLNGI